jgi:hypothetical protein
MDADVMITIWFCLEVLLFALAAGAVIARRVQSAQQEAAVAHSTAPGEPARIDARRLPAPAADRIAADASEQRGGRASRAPAHVPSVSDAVDDSRRLLVVADAYCDEAALCDEIEKRLEGVAVHLVVPVRVSHLHFLANDEAEEREDAEQKLASVLGLLRGRGISATGAVGTDKPLESITDALAAYPATQVLLALPPAEDSYWLEHDLLEKTRALTKLPVSQIVVPRGEAA